VVGLFGLMGAGRSELARILFGLDPCVSGSIELNGAPVPDGIAARIAAGMAFVTENRRDEGLMMEASIADNLALVSLQAFGRGPLAVIDEVSIVARTEGARRDLTIKAGDIRTQPVRALSGGNQQKVVIGKWQMTAPRLFMLDEPTRGVDVGAKREIYSLIESLAASGTAVLVISSDLEEILRLSDRILVLHEGHLAGTLTRQEASEASVMQLATGSSPRRPAA
jgi:ribose transport system ATP-binding protein